MIKDHEDAKYQTDFGDNKKKELEAFFGIKIKVKKQKPFDL